jgi:hypothetical protein
MEGLRYILVSKEIQIKNGAEASSRNGPLKKYGWLILPSTLEQPVFPSIATPHEEEKGVSTLTPFSFREWMKHHMADQSLSWI